MAGVDITLTKDTYLQKLLLHAQYVRWLSASRCYCLTEEGEVDPQCDDCGGRGYLYKHQTVFDIFGENSPHCANRVKPINTPISEVVGVRRCSWNYNVVSNTETEIKIALAGPEQAYADPGQVIEVDYKYSIEKEYDGVVTYLAGGICVVPLPLIRFRDGQVVGDITDAIEVRNIDQAITYTPISFFRNQVFIDVSGGEPDPDDVIEVHAKYIDPFRFLLMNMQERIDYQDGFVLSQGDAKLTVPYNAYIGDGDIIVQLVGEQRGNQVLERADGTDDELWAFDVSRILRIDDASSNSYTFGTDFIIVEGNRIRWLSGGNSPSAKYSVQFLYHPAYKVFVNKPNVRTPENQKMPRHATLMIYDKINANYDLKVKDE